MVSWQRSGDAAAGVLEMIKKEYFRAIKKFPRVQSSPHEMYAVLLEEVDELWDEVKGKNFQRNLNMQDELIQIGAMVVRFFLEATETAHRDVS